MDGDPHAVIEGLLIPAYAIGAHEGSSMRASVPLAVRQRKARYRAAEERGFLGEDVFGSGWAFKLKIKRAPAPSCAARASPHRLHHGRARDAAKAAAVSRGLRPLGQAHRHQ